MTIPVIEKSDFDDSFGISYNDTTATSAFDDSDFNMNLEFTDYSMPGHNGNNDDNCNNNNWNEHIQPKPFTADHNHEYNSRLNSLNNFHHSPYEVQEQRQYLQHQQQQHHDHHIANGNICKNMGMCTNVNPTQIEPTFDPDIYINTSL